MGGFEIAPILVCWVPGECTGWVPKPLWHPSPSLQVLSWALGGWGFAATPELPLLSRGGNRVRSCPPLATSIQRQTCLPFSKDISLVLYLRQTGPTGDQGIWEKVLPGSLVQ